jgi:excisionase family DNA binding protein
MQKQLLSVDDVAEKTGLSGRTIRRLIASGELPVHRIGRSIRISEDDLARFIAACRRAG